jgi:putative restriction endonuclease
MTLGIFLHRHDSIYDDSPAERYHFPRQYLGRVQACVGDWIIYLEPSKVRQSRGYFAVARIQEVIPDPSIAGMYFAIVEAGSYCDFPNPVAFNGSEGVLEQGVVNEAGRMSGRAQSAVRAVSPVDFNRIFDAGFAEAVLLPRTGEMDANRVQEDIEPFEFEVPRNRFSVLNSRIIRDRSFRRLILQAYDERCAITGLKLINGGGRAEVEAAHIRPVEHNGPDATNNGIAMSGTAHWMFDRGLISLSDDLTIMVSRTVNDVDSILGIVNRSGKALPPENFRKHPHPAFLNWHRENCFKN